VQKTGELLEVWKRNIAYEQCEEKGEYTCVFTEKVLGKC